MTDKNPSDMTTLEITNNLIQSWFDIIDDIMYGNFKNIFTKHNRLFFIGLTMIIFSIILFVSYDIYCH